MTMKYSFEQFYVWYQYGLSLISDQKVFVFSIKYFSINNFSLN
jgi:hypothetical protein